MMPIWVALVFLVVITSYTFVDVQRIERLQAQVQTDSAALSFMVYRRSAQEFLRANPNHTGMIGVNVLQEHLPPGHASLAASTNASWRAVVSSGRLFVFSTAPPPEGMLAQLWREAGQMPTVGLSRLVNGQMHLIAHDGSNTGIILPADIPAHVLVMIGN